MRIIIAGETYDLGRVTLGEMAAVERATGRTWQELNNTNNPSVLATLALVYIALKRRDPSVKFTDDAVQNVSLEDMDIELDDEPEQPAEPDPTPHDDAQGVLTLD